MAPGLRQRPLPDGLTPAERAFYDELRRLTVLAGLSARGLERLAASPDGLFVSKSTWARWLNAEGSPPPLRAVRLLSGYLAGLDISGRQLEDLWKRAFAAPPGGPAGERPRQLPPAIPHFTGRDAEMAALAGLARQAAAGGGTVAITAIGGTPGVGKTALAVHWAHQAAAQFPDGQLYVNLRGYDPGEPVTPAEALRGFLEALGVPAGQIPSSPHAQAGLYRSLLAGRLMLIVLDNARDPAQVRPLLPGTPGSLVLVTSRSQMTGLAAADGASQVTLGVLSDEEARALLGRRLGEARPAAEPAAVSDLIGLCARLPLALNIVAARAAAQPGLPLSQLAAGLRAQPAALDVLDTGEDSTSARTVFSWSCRALPAAAAAMFRLLGLHPGPDITAAAAGSLAGTSAAAAGRELRTLTAANLLAEHVPGRYAFHDLLRAYAAEQAAETDSAAARQACAVRLTGHYLHTARAAVALLCPGRDLPALDPPPPGVTPEHLAGAAAALDWFAAEYPVLTRAAAADGPAAWLLGWTVGRYLHRRGRYQDWIAVLRAALNAARAAGDLGGQAWVHRDLGAAHADQGSARAAEPHLQQAMELCGQLGDTAGQAHTCLYTCRMLEAQGRPGEALDHALRALGLFRAAGHTAGQANALTSAGSCHGQLGEYEKALACYQEALPLHAASANADGECYAWSGLGETLHHLGQHGQAIDCGRRAVALCRDLGSLRLLATALTHLGDHLQAAGDADAARQSWREALAILDELRHPAAAQVRGRLSPPDPAVAV